MRRYGYPNEPVTVQGPSVDLDVTMTPPQQAGGAACKCAILGLRWWAYAETPDVGQNHVDAGDTELFEDQFTATFAQMATGVPPERTLISDFRFVAQILGDLCPGTRITWNPSRVLDNPADAYGIAYLGIGRVFIAANLQSHAASPQTVTVNATVSCPGQAPVTTNEITLLIYDPGGYT